MRFKIPVEIIDDAIGKVHRSHIDGGYKVIYVALKDNDLENYLVSNGIKVLCESSEILRVDLESPKQILEEYKVDISPTTYYTASPQPRYMSSSYLYDFLKKLYLEVDNDDMAMFLRTAYNLPVG